jgi:steroid delta-isomerase-like uncharacterized protein
VRVAPFLIAALLSAPICRTADAGTAENVRTAKRVFLESMADGRFDRLNEIYGPNFVAHGASRDYTLEQDVADTREWRRAMPDLRVRVERTVAAGDLVAVHWKVVGTNTVAAGGMPGKGDPIGIEGMTFFRFSSGRIVEEWTVLDVAMLRKELGERPDATDPPR